MGLLERCYQAYEKNKAQVGKPSTSLRTGWEAPVLLPVAHTTQKSTSKSAWRRTGPSGPPVWCWRPT